MVSDTRLHRRSDAQGLVNPSEVVEHVMDRLHVFMIFNFLGKSICQPGEAAHGHTHREILAFNHAG